jgi:hypothetical protein
VADLVSATRRVPKATYQSIVINVDGQRGAALAKADFLRSLSLQPGEVNLVRERGLASGQLSQSQWSVLQGFEAASPENVAEPPLTALAPIATDVLSGFGKTLIDVRSGGPESAAAGWTGPRVVGGQKPLAAPEELKAESRPGLAKAFNLVAVAKRALSGFEDVVAVAPIGMLNLERLDMTPAGIERGELIATIPLAPGEQTSVVQKEWSVTSREFTTIVTDSLENYSETGVTENNDLSQSTDSQTQHSNQFNINASVSGSYGFVTASVATGVSISDQVNSSQKESRTHAIATTRKASARTRQEHKVSISSTTVTGQSETSTRMLVNPSTTDPLRIDYFSMMRKWHVSLYRYGLRLTYDIGIPEPGAAMREPYAQLDDLRKKAAGTFNDFFKVTLADINDHNYPQLASAWGTTVPDPPAPTDKFMVGGVIPGLTNNDDDQSWHFVQLPVTIREGYAISRVTVNYMLSHVSVQRNFYVFGASGPYDLPGGTAGGFHDMTAENGFMAGLTGQQEINYFVQNFGAGSVIFTIELALLPSTHDAWVAQVWTALRDAAQNQFYANQQALNSEINAIETELEGVDTLTLRREENDEIMRGVLKWLLGPTFDFMPDDIVQLFVASKADISHGVAFVDNNLTLSADQWSATFRYEEMVKFISEAIEWENVLYFLNSYFWDVPAAWDFIRQIRHPDATRQAFLRGGSARVVLTVRKGFEEAWMSFVENGHFSALLPPDHPYMSVAQQIKAFDETNYPGIPPANPDHPGDVNDEGEKGQLIAEWFEYTPSSGTDIAVASDLSKIG